MNQLYTRLRPCFSTRALFWALIVLLGPGLPGLAQAQCPTIDKVTVSGCYYNTSGQSLATVTVQVGFGSTGTGNITVSLQAANGTQTRTITPGPITVVYTGTISGAQTIVSPQVVAFDVPANGATVTVTAARAGCGTANWGQAIQIPTACAPTTCPANALGGAVFFDFNANGLREAGETVGVAGVTVTAYPKAGAPLTTQTDGFGQFSLTVPAAAYPVRLEYSAIPKFLSGGRSGPNGAGSRTTVQFLTAPTCQANLGVLNQNEFCNPNPLIMTPCYVSGDPLAGGTAGSDPAMVGFPYNSTGRTVIPKTFMLPASGVGATWAMAYNKSTKRLFSSAVVRRHAGLGPLGLGGIYQVDLTNPTIPAVSGFLDVAADLGINVGSIASNPARGLVGNSAAKSNDPQAFSAVGKVGIGGMDFSDDNTKLYFTNVFDNTVYQIDMTAYNAGGPKPTSANVKPFPIPNPGCVGGTVRSWALKAYRSYVYAGVVCDASTSTKSNMVSYVYRLDPATGVWTQIFSIPMTYPKGYPGYPNITGWFAWTDNFASYSEPSNDGGISYPQPIFSDIEFDVDGSMVLAFIDRTGMQFSSGHYGLTGTKAYYTFSGGDILRAFNSNGTFILENNSKAGPASGYGPGNNQGPGFGEFYNDNLTLATDPNALYHAEDALGGIALRPGSGEVVVGAMDPINFLFAGDNVANSGGVRFLSNTTGTLRDGFMVYQTYSNGVNVAPGTAAKSTGLGDMELACAQANYIELGNRLWKDANRNGVQDPGEQPLAGMQMQLFKGPTLVASTTTNAGGEYYFSTLLGHNLTPNTTYNILFGTGQFSSGSQEFTIGSNKYKLTTPNTGQGINAEQNDSDADPNVLSTALGNRPAGVPQIVVTTGDYGFVDHSFDAGVYCSDITTSVTAVAATCPGATNNNDGQVLITSAANASRYAVSVGSSFTGVAFSAATPIGSSFPVTIISNAPNTGQVYTVRFFNGSDDCLQDVIVNVPQSCTVNSCTAVGGTTGYGGNGVLCSSSNVGSLTVTGQSGTVVRWQTSTSGGASWTDLPNSSGQSFYTFVNAQNGQQYRAVLNTATICPDVYAAPVTLSANPSGCTSANCDSGTGSLTVTTSGPTPGAGQTSRVVIVDPSGIIRAVSGANANTVANLAPGSYQAYQVIFDNAQVPALTAGTSVSAVGGGCVRWSNALPVKVCSSSQPTVAISGPANGTTTTTLTPLISGTATAGSTVTVTGGPGSTGGPVTALVDNNGNWTASGITFPFGPTSVTAVAGTPTGGSSSPATSNFTATGPPSLTVAPPAGPGPLTQPVSGTATPGSNVTITNPAGQVLCTVTVGSSGTFTCPVALTSGVNNLTVTACNSVSCISKPQTLTAVPAPTIAVNPIPSPSALSPTVSGTATPGADIDIVDANGTTLCSTTATPAGNYSCVVNLLAGPQTLTAIATNDGGTASATTNSFTVTGPPTLIVDQPVVPTRITDPITGTATPGSIITITNPAGQTVCTTTASSSGTFSCAAPLTAGVNNLTVTACNPAGCTSQPTSRTTATAPTIAVDPLPTTTTLSPTVSGTATPGALVTIMGPNSTTLCTTTATPAGNYSCVVSLSPGGPQTLTAVATNPAGTASATTTPFTATGPPTLTVAPPVPGPLTQPVPGTATPGSIVTITNPTGQTLCQTTASSSGTFACPVTLPPGVTSLTVTACNASGCTTKPLTVTAVPAPTIAVDPLPVTSPLTPTVSGTATPGALVAILGPNSTTLCSTTASVSGSYSCVVNLSPGGPQTLTATATNPGGTGTATTNSFTATGPPSLTVAPPVPGPLTQPIAGTATPGSIVTITNPTGQTLCQTTASSSGTFACPVTLPPGVTSLTVTACNASGCTTKPLTVTAVPAPTIAVDPLPVTSPLTPTVSGTATPGALVAILGPNSTTLCSTTATASGSYSCVVNLSPGGPQTLTATATNPGGTGTATTNSFTATGPPSLTVAPPVPGPLTQPIAGTATPGSIVTITNPTGQTLCQTTASSSGTFSCPVTLPPGVTSLTVTACNTAGCTTKPLTLTAVPAPTIAVDPLPVTSPLTPTVSGTATPGALVAILGPNSTTLCSTTASVSGSYSCVVNLSPGGPQTLTATATNPGGTGTATTNSFTATGPPSLTVAPPVPGPLTQPVPGTATPGSQVVITNPTGQTLCTTTASSSGTFACPVTLPPGVTSLTVTACNTAGCTTKPLTLTVADAPVVIPDIANTNPGTPVSGNVLTNDRDPQGLPLTASLTTPPTVGTVTMASDGSYTYTPPAGFTGTTGFCYEAVNTATRSSSACVTVNVNPPPSPTTNNRPVANDDNTRTTTGSPVTVAVLANDTDADAGSPAGAGSPNGQLANPTLLTQPTVGTAVVNANGTITYTPPVGFVGAVRIPYQVCDQATPPLCATATMNVNVQPTVPTGTTAAPVAVDDALLTTRNTSATGTVATNDYDPNSPARPLTYTGGQPQHGTVTMLPTGNYAYIPTPGYSGPDSFTYAVCNTGGQCSRASVSVLVQRPVNQPPTVTPDFVDVVPGQPAKGNVLTNDKDPEGDPLTATIVGTPPPGLILSPDGSYTYTAPTGTTAPVTVPVQVCDNSTPPACATSTLTLVPVPPAQPGSNNAPVANPDAPRTTVGKSLTVNVLANDLDPDGNPLGQPVLVSGPTHGTAVVNPDGTVSYTPAAGYTGPDQLVYRVCDLATVPLCSTAVVGLSVDPTPPAGATNTAPVAIDDALLTTRNTSATGTVAANDYDPQGQPLTYTRLSGPANGTVVFSPTGSYTYTPASGYVGSDAFTYQVCDGATPPLCSTATAHLATALPAGPVLTVDPPKPGPTTQPITGTATPGSQVVITDPTGQTLCTTTASTAGLFACSVTLPPGVTSLTVTACNIAGCVSQPTSRTAVPVPTIAIDPLPTTGPLTPTVSGTATPGALVNILGPNSTTLCSTTASVSGSYSCVVNLSPGGPQTLTATATNPGGTGTATTNSFTATGPPSLTVAPPVPGPLTQPVPGTATPGSQLVITNPTGQTLCSVTVGNSGTFSCPVTLPPGVTSLTVTACNAAGCTTKPLSLTALPVPTIAITGPTGTLTTTTPTVSGTATPGSLVTILGPNSTTLCSTTATPTGSYSCVVNVPNGPVSLTAVAINPGGTGTATTSFTATGVPSLVIEPVTPGQPDPTILGITDPGAKVVITDPSGNTLCSTTAGVSGTFSCTVTLPTGTTNVTVTACNVAGCTSKTAVVPTANTVSLTVRVLLQGALFNVNSGTLMRDDLRTGGYLPLTSPYSATVSPRFTQSGGGGNEKTTPAVLNANGGTPNAIVDWVLVELRSATNPTQIVATRSGLVQRDGDVVLPADGTSPVTFTGLTGTATADRQYFVSVKHRNHLGAMTATALPLSAAGTVVDFTTMPTGQVYDKPGAVSYDGVEMVTVNGKRALWAGDANTDGKVKYIGGASDNAKVLDDVITAQGAIQNPAYNYDFAFGYFYGDVDMNSKAKYQGGVNDPTLIFNNVIVAFPLNIQQLYNYDFLIEQLP